jgi:tetratricopeptide (TPR) repeat protein
VATARGSLTRAATFTALLVVLPLGFAACAAHSKDTNADVRILYYRARLGGPGTYPAYARLGLALEEKARATGDVSLALEAADNLETSLSMQPNYEALLGLSAVSLALHRFPEALARAKECVATMPGDPAAQGALFDAWLGLGDHQAAEKVLDGMSAKPDFGYLVRRAALHEYRGETAAAVSDVEQACEQAADKPAATRAWCQVRLGALELAMCEPEKARASYQRAAAIDPSFLLAAEHLAELDAGEGRSSDAIAFYQHRLETIPSRATAWLSRISTTKPAGKTTQQPSVYVRATS